MTFGLPLDGDRKPFPVVQTNYDESWAQFSPDGKWIAYASNESGEYQIYVQPFSGPFSGQGMVGGKRQISVNGGAYVQWRRDGKELFYLAPDNRLMAVPIRLVPDRQLVLTRTREPVRHPSMMTPSSRPTPVALLRSSFDTQIPSRSVRLAAKLRITTMEAAGMSGISEFCDGICKRTAECCRQRPYPRAPGLVAIHAYPANA